MVLGACQQRESPASGSAPSATAPAPSSSTAVLGKTAVEPSASALKSAPPCEEDWDCKAQSGCKAVCTRTSATRMKYCQVEVVSSRVGDGPCIGNRLGVSTSRTFKDDVMATAVLCDVGADVYCDEDAGACARAKKVGEQCWLDSECGKDGECADHKCAVAASTGQSCKDRRCKIDSFCDDKNRCRKVKAIGADCSESKECESLSCTGKCVPKEEKTCSVRPPKSLP